MYTDLDVDLSLTINQNDSSSDEADSRPVFAGDLLTEDGQAEFRAAVASSDRFSIKQRSRTQSLQESPGRRLVSVTSSSSS